MYLNVSQKLVHAFTVNRSLPQNVKAVAKELIARVAARTAQKFKKNVLTLSTRHLGI